MPQFSDAQWNLEIRPIVGWRKGDYVIINPIVDMGFGQNGDSIFAPCARFARNLGENLAVGLEYYTDLGPLRNFSTFNEQQQTSMPWSISRSGASTWMRAWDMA
jgi:hypothetical protein